MAEIKSLEEPPLQPKRKHDAEPLDCPDKSRKLEPSGDLHQTPRDSDGNSKGAQLHAAEPGGSGGEEDASEDEDGAEKSNGQAMADRKGKGILSGDKGKGKLIVDEEDEDDGNDDSSSGGSDLEDGGDSDLSDDPLAEVDLDNILPSRTRRRQVQPGVYIANDLGNNDDDDDDSDDSDD